jgi:hypothetical protein
VQRGVPEQVLPAYIDVAGKPPAARLPSFSELYVAALKALRGKITAARYPSPSAPMAAS